MADETATQRNNSSRDALLRTVIVVAGIATAMMVILGGMGRRFWCQCEGWSPWAWDIWSSHNSQHLLDPYFFTHVLHGLLFYAGLRFVPKLELGTRLLIAAVIEAVWEIVENSPLIINRYREVTMAIGYTGDSIANSLFDLFACILGFLIACRLPWKISVALFVVTEIALLVTIRDCLILNVVMLIHPIPGLQQWQMG